MGCVSGTGGGMSCWLSTGMTSGISFRSMTGMTTRGGTWMSARTLTGSAAGYSRGEGTRPSTGSSRWVCMRLSTGRTGGVYCGNTGQISWRFTTRRHTSTLQYRRR